MTVVSHIHKFVFLKTHKTASTSIEMLLEPLCRPPGWSVEKKTNEAHSAHGIVGRRHGGKAKPFRLFNWRDHMTAHDCRRALGKKRWDSYAKIATVRDPFDRILSHYFWRQRTSGASATPENEMIANFRDFVANATWDDDTSIVMLDGKYVPDHTIRFERMTQDISDLCDKLSLPIDPGNIPQSNASANKKRPIPAEDFFDTKTIEIVKKRLAWVFDNFDYACSPAGETV